MAQKTEARAGLGEIPSYIINFVLNCLPGVSVGFVMWADSVHNFGVSKKEYLGLAVFELLKVAWMTRVMDFGGLNNGETWVPGMLVFGLMGMALSRWALSGDK